MSIFTDEYRYTLKSTRDNSYKYGNCVVCDRFASEVFYQSELRKYWSAIKQDYSWTAHGCHNLFGHHDCLIRQRKSGDTNPPTNTRSSIGSFGDVD